MPTRIYNSYTDWMNRPARGIEFRGVYTFSIGGDMDINGVSPEFAAANPNWREMNETNKACWNCLNCTDCHNCRKCTDCRMCSLSDDNTNCVNCKEIARCRNCISCSACTECIDCLYCENCVYCNQRTGLYDTNCRTNSLGYPYRTMLCPPDLPSSSGTSRVSTSKQFPQTKKQLLKELKFRDKVKHGGHQPKGSDYYEMQADLLLAERRVPTKQPGERLPRAVDPTHHNYMATDALIFLHEAGNFPRALSRPPSYELPTLPPRYRSPPRRARSSPKRSSGGKRRQRLWYSN